MQTMPLLLSTSPELLDIISDSEDVIKCYERDGLSIGGYLVVYESQRTIVLRGGLSPEERTEGIAYLLDRLTKNLQHRRKVYIWKGLAKPSEQQTTQ